MGRGTVDPAARRLRRTKRSSGPDPPFGPPSAARATSAEGDAPEQGSPSEGETPLGTLNNAGGRPHAPLPPRKRTPAPALYQRRAGPMSLRHPRRGRPALQRTKPPRAAPWVPPAAHQPAAATNNAGGRPPGCSHPTGPSRPPRRTTGRSPTARPERTSCRAAVPRVPPRPAVRRGSPKPTPGGRTSCRPTPDTTASAARHEPEDRNHVDDARKPEA